MQHKRLDFLAALSGLLIALQARANGELSHRLGNGLQAALVSFTSGLIIIVVIALFNPSIKEGVRTLRRAVIAKAIPPWTLFAGMLGASFVAEIYRSQQFFSASLREPLLEYNVHSMVR